jgi:cyclic dehypoxanthinyl futalosine synthase
MSMTVDALAEHVRAGGRLSREEARALYADAPTALLGRLADDVRLRKHPGGVVTYIIDRNVNYTNVCVTRCKFCNFYRPPTNKTDGYVLTREQLTQKFQETVDLGGVQILLQGGLNPDLPLTWYEDLFRWMKASFPLAIHGLSPEEAGLAQLEALGAVTRSSGARLASLRPVRSKGRPASQAVIEGREDRF